MNLRRSCAHPTPVFETMPAPGAWIADAACAGKPTDLFFPEDSQGIQLAKAICAGCRVRAECAGYATAIPSLAGIWGGSRRAKGVVFAEDATETRRRLSRRTFLPGARRPAEDASR